MRDLVLVREAEDILGDAFRYCTDVEGRRMLVSALVYIKCAERKESMRQLAIMLAPIERSYRDVEVSLRVV